MDKNQTVAKKIWHDYLQCSTKPFSWGLNFNSVKVIEDGTAFHVQGMVCGWIKVQQDTSTKRYKITITPDNSMESKVVYHTTITFALSSDLHKKWQCKSDYIIKV